MVKKMLIDATHNEETRVVVVEGNKIEEYDFETSKSKNWGRIKVYTPQNLVPGVVFCVESETEV